MLLKLVPWIQLTISQRNGLSDIRLQATTWFNIDPNLRCHMTWPVHNELRLLCCWRDSSILEGVRAQYCISHSPTFLVLVATLSEHITIEFCPPHFYADKQMVWIRYQPATKGNETRLLLIYYSSHVLYKILQVWTNMKEIGFGKNLPESCYNNTNIWKNNSSH